MAIRRGGISTDEKDPHQPAVLLPTTPTASEHANANEASALDVLFATGAIPSRGCSSREQYIHTLGAATTALLRRASCNESETSLFPSIRATAPGLLPADCECIATFRRGDELTKRSIRLQAMEILLIEVVDVEAVAATVCVLGWDCPFFHARHSSRGR